ncbi:hypothetical protein P154DRAFT_536290 [Amniculicola lignicola CBS 123094]|uniref:CFEM domain-containing protein n=1 Tax=Amniculicola lignicola CBS 123094 TaxID=1392246 RepID=A0A6A5WAT8_9PLEO|nr:hypothetical protein P154DRAFT_536290 [Amniculicola lignicola CBS 123094]
MSLECAQSCINEIATSLYLDICAARGVPCLCHEGEYEARVRGCAHSKCTDSDDIVSVFFGSFCKEEPSTAFIPPAQTSFEVTSTEISTAESTFTIGSETRYTIIPSSPTPRETTLPPSGLSTTSQTSQDLQRPPNSNIISTIPKDPLPSPTFPETSPSTTSSPQTHYSLSTRAKLGLAAGIPCAIIFIFVLITLAFILKRKRRKLETPPPRNLAELGGGALQELETQERSVELEAPTQVQELEDDRTSAGLQNPKEFHIDANDSAISDAKLGPYGHAQSKEDPPIEK